ncbi:WD40-repeat-containing domain protein [Scheffersomyces coipomensis]|uniref:WD40-repeat-containing domain protein n=1 Tax=Scheffersomyces coipomensis TaxID=1788519 RepID=UPI00315DCE8B
MKYRSFEAHTNSSINSCVHFNNNYLLTGGGNDFRLKLHNLSSDDKLKSPILFPKYHTNSINALDISQTFDFIVSASNDNIIVIDVIRRTKLHSMLNSPMVEGTEQVDIQPNTNHAKDQVLDCKVLNDCMIASCGVNHHLNVFDLRQPNFHKPVYSINLGNDNLNCLDFNKSSYDISIGSSNGDLYTVDIRNQNLMIDKFDYKESSILNVSKYEKDDWNLINFDNGTIELLNRDKSKTANYKILNPTTTENAIEAISYKLNSQYIPTSNYIINGTTQGVVEVWKYNPLTSKISKLKQLSIPPTSPSDTTLKNVNSNQSAAKVLSYVHYNQSTNQLISTSGSGFIHIWDYVF